MDLNTQSPWVLSEGFHRVWPSHLLLSSTMAPPTSHIWEEQNKRIGRECCNRVYNNVIVTPLSKEKQVLFGPNSSLSQQKTNFKRVLRLICSDYLAFVNSDGHLGKRGNYLLGLVWYRISLFHAQQETWNAKQHALSVKKRIGNLMRF